MRINLNPTRRWAHRGFLEPVFAFAIALIFISSWSLGFAQVPPSNSEVAKVRIGVFGLFHPDQLTISPPPGQALVVRAGDDRIVLEHSSGVPTASVLLNGSEIVLQSGPRTVRARGLTIAGRKNEPVDFVLAVPRKIARHYRGTLEIRQSAGHLLAIVTMDREIAVASIVAAENTTETPFEALKAQADATSVSISATLPIASSCASLRHQAQPPRVPSKLHAIWFSPTNPNRSPLCTRGAARDARTHQWN